MNRSNVAALFGTLVVLGACAHNNAATIPVAVAISSRNAGRRFVRDVRTTFSIRA